MILKVALVLLAVWMLGVLGFYEIGRLMHIPLLVGLMLLLLAFARERQATLQGDRRPERPPSRR